jgi:hypothetical protein
MSAARNRLCNGIDRIYCARHNDWRGAATVPIPGFSLVLTFVAAVGPAARAAALNPAKALRSE